MIRVVRNTIVISSTLLLPAIGFAAAAAKIAPAKTNPAVIKTTKTATTGKTIQIYNNSKETIYPVVEIARTVAGVSHPYDYRVYVGADMAAKKDNGLAPGKSATFTLPSTDWYKGGRVYLFDSQPKLPDASNLQPGNNNVFVDKSGSGFQPDERYQLVEYTFTSKLADYDISYVDHIYLPVAVEVNNGSVGYNGTGMNIADFQKDVVQFTQAFPYWPQYRLPTGLSNIKIPGGYNVFAQDQSPSSNFSGKLMLNAKRESSSDNKKPGKSVALNSMLVQWQKWVNDSNYCQEILKSQVSNNGRDLAFCQAFQKNVQDVWQAFQKNATDQGHNATPEDVLEHIIGYTNFGGLDGSWIDIKTKDDHIGKEAIAIEAGIPYSATGKYDKLKYPSYNSPYNLNPYVAFVHRVMNLNAYAFSIDDAIGNVNIPGNGFVIAVGSLNGIPNKKPYVPASSYKLRLNSGPGWTDINVCGVDHKIPANQKAGTSYPITQDKQCKVSLKQGNKATLSFIATKASEQSGTTTPCTGDECSQVKLDYNEHDGSLNVDVPAASSHPTPPPPSGDNRLSVYIGAGTLGYDGSKTAAPHTHVTITDVKSGEPYTLTSNENGKSVTCTVTVNGKSITPSANCDKANGFGTFHVTGTKDGNGFIIQSP